MSEPILIPKITWHDIDDDDFVAKHDGYTLRVEQMDKKRWWWAVYRGDVELANIVDCRTETEAKLKAELTFLKDYIKSKLTEK